MHGTYKKINHTATSAAQTIKLDVKRQFINNLLEYKAAH
jgi:hypothetical protein